MRSSQLSLQPNARIAALYAQGLVDYLASRGVEIAILLPGCELGKPESDERATETSLLEWIQLLDAATEFLNEPELPANAGASLQPRHLGALGTVLMSCDTLSDAYEQLSRYIRLLGQIGQPELVTSGTDAELIWRWPYATSPPQSVAIFMLAARVRFMRWLTGIPDLAVNATIHGRAPGPLMPYRKIFGGYVHFGQRRSALQFPVAFLDYAVITADREFRKQAEERAQSQLKALTGEPAIIQQTKRIVVSRLASGRIAIADTARAMHVSARTLQRRLRDEKVSYQLILDQVRAECAEGLIRDSSIPLAEIAFMLGYRDQSTFQTAYRRWFRNSPGRTRKKILQKAP